ncbi:MAG: hypothetical protein AAGI66_02470 [Cyanobacteria bacterium P01_H01_bin.74]
MPVSTLSTSPSQIVSNPLPPRFGQAQANSPRRPYVNKLTPPKMYDFLGSPEALTGAVKASYHHSDSDTVKAGQYLAYQWNDLFMPLLFGVPFVGAALALVSWPFSVLLSRHGESKAATHSQNLSDKHPVSHLYQIQHEWSASGETAPNRLAERTAAHLNGFLDKWFTVPGQKNEKLDGLKDSLKLNKDSAVFKGLIRMANARRMLNQNTLLSVALKPLDMISRVMSRFLPRLVSMVPLIPKTAVLGYFFCLEEATKQK